MKQRSAAVLAILLFALAALVWVNGTDSDGASSEASTGAGLPSLEAAGAPDVPTGQDTDGTTRSPENPSARDDSDREQGSAALLVRNVAVRDVDGRIAWRGDVDLAPALQRIEAGVSDPHRNDGGVFGNREGHLPAQPRGYYREYVVRTPGISHAGPQRLVLGKGGEVYYTFDHYESFRRIR